MGWWIALLILVPFAVLFVYLNKRHDKKQIEARIAEHEAAEAAADEAEKQAQERARQAQSLKAINIAEMLNGKE